MPDSRRLREFGFQPRFVVFEPTSYFRSRPVAAARAPRTAATRAAGPQPELVGCARLRRWVNVPL
jgi:hypothetical protein